MSYRRKPSTQESSGALMGFAVGCAAGLVIGAAVGMLMAPHRGDITRRRLVRRANETRDQVVDRVEDLMVHRMEDEDVDVDEETGS